MAGFFSRLFKIGQAEAHSAIDKLEDPIKLTEQGIRDLKNDLQESLKSLAEVKGIAIRMKKETEDNKNRASEYERKAMLLLQRAKSGQLDMSEADRLATEAIIKKEEFTAKAAENSKLHQQHQKMVDQLEGNVNSLKSKISSYENDLVTLRARSKTATSIKKINQQMAQIDSSGTIAMLEKMKSKVEEDESLAIAYGEIANVDKGIDEEINTVLSKTETKQIEVQYKLAELKAKLGMNEPA
jgi:phage shock protein A